MISETFKFIDLVVDIIGRFLSWLGSLIFTFGNVSRDISFIIGQSGLIFFHYIDLTRKLSLFPIPVISFIMF